MSQSRVCMLKTQSILSRHGGTLKRRVRESLVLALLCAVALMPSTAWGWQESGGAIADPAAQTEPAPTQPVRDAISPKTIQDQITQLEAVTDLDEKGRAALELLRKALVSLQQADEYAAKAREYQQITQGAPDRLKQFEARLAAPAVEADVSQAESMTTEQIRGELNAAQAALDAARQARQLAEQDATTRAQRREQIPVETANLRRDLSAIEQRQLAPPNGAEDATLTEAQRLNLLAERKRLEQNISMLEEELRSYDARRDGLRVRRQVAERDVQDADKRVQAWQAAMTAHEQAEAARLAQQAREAQVAAESVHPIVAEQAETNRKYATERTELIPKIESSNASLNKMRSTLEKLTDDLRNVRTRVEQSGTTTTLGLLLRNKRASLPDIGVLERDLRERAVEIARVQLLRSELDDELLSLVSLDDAAEALMADREDVASLSPEQRAVVKEALIEQLRRRKEEFIPGLIVSLDAYLEDTLARLDQVETQLVDVAREYLTFVDERILWIRSTSAVSIDTVTGAFEAAGWVFSARNWRTLAEALWHDVQNNWASVATPLIGLLALLGLQAAMRRRIDQIAGELRSYRTDTYGRTMAALGLTILVIILWPAMLWLLATRLVYASDFMGGDTAIFGRAAAMGFLRAARFLLVALTLWYFCRPRGLGEAHFRWRISTMKLIRRNLIWLIPIVTPAVFLLNLLEAQPNESYKSSLGRLVQMGLAIAVAVFLARLFRPESGILSSYLNRKRGGWFDRLRYVWYGAAIAMPIALSVASLAGYQYTSSQLGQVLFKTYALIIGATILHALLIRWLLVAQRKLALEQARKRKAAQAEAAAREAAAAAQQAAASGTAAETTPTGSPASAMQSTIAAEVQIEVQEFDISAIGDQTRRLVLLGVWFALLLGIWGAWSDVLPALGALRQVELTEHVQTITETVSAEDGTATVRSFDRLVPVTLADLLLSFLVVGLTVLATRNIPGLLEITILQRLPLAPSGRYAVLTICRYVIIIVGIVAAFGMIGIGWSQVQWLAAAITVGLGFGLQEIFANFVSGIIILFEQPIRVGDLVTINDVSGTVTKIRMRATTIRDWDRKELVVPNKVFVTDRIVNWTLSDTVLRIRVPVGIAYGSDTELARSILLDIARNHPLVLRDPEPQVWFTSFGDSTLDFDLRVFIGTADHLLNVRHDMLQAVDQAFRKAGIEIAFPQRDLHIRSGLDALAPKPSAKAADDTPRG